MAQPAFKLDWQQIDTVLVDMDGTLLDLAFDNHFWLELVPTSYAARHGLSIDEARERLRPRFDGVAGTLAWYCIDHWSRELALDIKAMKHDQRHLIRFLPRAPEFLAAIRERGKQLWIVTNAHRDTFAVKAARTGIGELVDRVVCSHDLDAPKESGDFWRRLQAAHFFDPQRTLLVEDSVAVLAAARAHGVQHTVAIRRPDSALPPRAIVDFPAVDGVADLLG
jgi:putative hydrolase of the HAD superfamily